MAFIAVGFVNLFVWICIEFLTDGVGAYCEVTTLTTCARNFQRRLGVAPGSSVFDGVLASEFKARLDNVCRLKDAKETKFNTVKNTFGSAVNNPYMIENRLPGTTAKPRRRHGKINRLSDMHRERGRLLTASVTPATVIARISGSVKHGTEKVRLLETPKAKGRKWPSSSTTKPMMSLLVVWITTLMSYISLN